MNTLLLFWLWLYYVFAMLVNSRDCRPHMHLLQFDESVTANDAVVRFLVVCINSGGCYYRYNYRYNYFSDDIFHGNTPTG